MLTILEFSQNPRNQSRGMNISIFLVILWSSCAWTKIIEQNKHHVYQYPQSPVRKYQPRNYTFRLVCQGSQCRKDMVYTIANLTMPKGISLTDNHTFIFTNQVPLGNSKISMNITFERIFYGRFIEHIQGYFNITVSDADFINQKYDEFLQNIRSVKQQYQKTLYRFKNLNKDPELSYQFKLHPKMRQVNSTIPKIIKQIDQIQASIEKERAKNETKDKQYLKKLISQQNESLAKLYNARVLYFKLQKQYQDFIKYTQKFQFLQIENANIEHIYAQFLNRYKPYKFIHDKVQDDLIFQIRKFYISYTVAQVNDQQQRWRLARVDKEWIDAMDQFERKQKQARQRQIQLRQMRRAQNDQEGKT